MAHQNLGLELLKRVEEAVGDAGKVEARPRTEGRQMTMMIASAK
jgi:translation initiation factor IF-3